MRKKTKGPQACYLDNAAGGEGEALLLEARIKTLRQNGEKAMSPADLKNGYSPSSIIRLLEGQVLYLRDNSPETLHAKANLATGHNLERSRLQKKGFEIQLPRTGQADQFSSIEETSLHLEYFKKIKATLPTLAKTWLDGLGRSWPLFMLRDEISRLEILLNLKIKDQNENQKKEGLPMEHKKNNDPGEANSAALLFEQTNDIRQAINTLKSEQRETRKAYKKAIATLELALEEIYQGFEDKQMLLFNEMPALAEEVKRLIEHPSITSPRAGQID